MLQGIKLAKSDNDIIQILKNVKTIAVIGSSPSREKDSYKITKYLIENNFQVFPVNPNYTEILGLKCYPSLYDIKVPVDLVNVFRRPEFSLDAAKEAADVKSKAIWFQFGVATDEAVKFALEHNLTVVYDRCIKIEYSRLFF